MRSPAGRVAVAVASVILLVGGCSGSSDAGSSEAPAEGGRGPVAAEDGNAGVAAGGSGGRAPGRHPGSGAALPRVVPETQAIVYTATLNVRARDVAAAASQAERIVASAGGYVADQQVSSARKGRGSATITFKVPTEEYREILEDLASRLGTRLHLEQRAEDVTQRVADVDARVRSAEASLDRLRRLLSEADSVDEVLSVEREIAERQAELESLQARQRSLAERTQYATVTLELSPPVAAKPTPETGFMAGLSAGWRAFAGTAGLLITAFGAVLPFLATFAILSYATWRAVLLVQRRRATAPPAAKPPS